jgi:hypothetical protein
LQRQPCSSWRQCRACCLGCCLGCWVADWMAFGQHSDCLFLPSFRSSVCVWVGGQ